jgi:hypothetical protein
VIRSRPKRVNRPTKTTRALRAGRWPGRRAFHVSQELGQVIEWASRLLRVAVVAPSIVAITTPEPPEVAEIDSVAACVESVTFR